MGMFDTFKLKKPATCPICKKGKMDSFQTKEFDRLLETFIQGRKARYYTFRDLTEKEKIVYRKELKSSGLSKQMIEFSVNYALKKTKKFTSSISDGEYIVYDICPRCNRFIEMIAVVKNGYFKGVKYGKI